MSQIDAEGMRLALERLNRNRLSRILAPLIHRHALLVESEGAFRYALSKAGAAPFDAVIPREDAEALIAQDLIQKRGRGYCISQAGRAWLKRALSPGDPFQAQHGARRPELREMEDGQERPVIVNDAESPLAWLARRTDKSGAPLIAPCQFAAGERLRADYTYAGLTGRLTASYGPQSGRSGGGEEAAYISETVLAARQRVSHALKAVGPELAGVLLDVCCHLKGLEEVEQEEGWPRRSGKIVLQKALTSLARHYGLISEAQALGEVRRRLQHWGTGDYRPSFDAGGPAAAHRTAEAS